MSAERESSILSIYEDISSAAARGMRDSVGNIGRNNVSIFR